MKKIVVYLLCALALGISAIVFAQKGINVHAPPAFVNKDPFQSTKFDKTIANVNIRKNTGTNISIQPTINLGTKDVATWNECTGALMKGYTLSIVDTPGPYYRLEILDKGLLGTSVWPKNRLKITNSKNKR